jgi:hypothetical protein
MGVKQSNKRERKILISAFLTEKQINFLDRKIQPNISKLRSRGAVIRVLIDEAIKRKIL